MGRSEPSEGKSKVSIPSRRRGSKQNAKNPVTKQMVFLKKERRQGGEERAVVEDAWAPIFIKKISVEVEYVSFGNC